LAGVSGHYSFLDYYDCLGVDRFGKLEVALGLNMKLVAGLGITGQSVLRYLSALGEHALAFDTRNEFDVRSLSQTFEQVEFATGQVPTKWLSQFDEIVLSPGIAQSEPWVQALVAQGKRIIGDIELFARAADKPVIAITGSNGKSTVTTLVGECLRAQGYRAGVGGNIGLAALDLLNDEQDYDVYVLELSSFQLETTNSLKLKSAAVLNISEDHMDRYDSLEDYAQTKFQIFNQAEHCVYPIELQPSLVFIENAEVFGLGLPTSKQTYGVSENALMHLEEPLLAISDMKLSAPHYQLNALAAIALCQPFHVSSQTFKTVLSKFSGLPYRTEWVLSHEGVDWINDSKGTNVGATLAALD
jgi:UDP-N-acetylmuramoylalanine--D-glutamate ligase